MSAGVLFDSPGPATRARHRTYSIVAGVALLAVIAFVVYRLQVTGQLEYDKWEPFVTPRYIEAILVDGLLVTLQMTTSLRPILGRSPVLLTQEKKFFLQHWGDTMGESLPGELPKTVTKKETIRSDSSRNPYLEN